MSTPLWKDHTDDNGQARAYFRLPTSPQQATCTIRAQVTGLRLGATGPTQVLTALSDDGSGTFGSPFAPTHVIETVNPDGSQDLTWVNCPENTADIPIWSRGNDGAWVQVTTVPAGTTSYHFNHP